MEKLIRDILKTEQTEGGMDMTRRKDIFWGIYAAVMPILVIHLGGKAEYMLKEYASRTYDSITAFCGQSCLALIFGILLAVAAVRYLSRPVETSRVPLIGLCIGLGYCAVSMLYWSLLFAGIEAEFLFKVFHDALVLGSTKMMTFTGFYIVLLIYYLKTHTFVPNEELMKEIEENTEK